MSRVKTFQATGVAPDGRLYAGDLNSIQDHYADLMDLTQTLGVGTIQIGESGLAIVRFGAGDARLTGSFRADKIIRALGGLYIGAFTSTDRDAIATNFAPYGIVILNTTTDRFEWNVGTDGARVWMPLAFTEAGQLVFPDGTVQTTSARVPYVTSAEMSALTGLYDGMEVDLTDDKDTPTYVWRLVYRSAITDAYKWVFVGGAPWTGEQSAPATGLGTGTHLEPANGPTLAAPRNGYYYCDRASMTLDQNPGNWYVTPVARRAGATISAAPISLNYNALANQFNATHGLFYTAVVAGDVFHLGLNHSGSALGTYQRVMSISPVRLS